MTDYAYVTVLYKTNIYITGALVLGYTLMKTKTKIDRIILVTPDVSSEYRSLLSHFYTHIIEVKYITANLNIFLHQDTRFLEVFTKFQALSLIQYTKIILLDTDMIISQNIDHLFKLNAPAACIKHYNIKYGTQIKPELIAKNGKLVNTINAGLMLLKPDLNELNNICLDILHDNQLYKFKYPEQDYISLRYHNQWTSITFNYNYQFGLTHRISKLKYNIDKIYVIHYSSSHKPWNCLIKDYVEDPEETAFKNKHSKYYDLWLNIYNYLNNKYLILQ